MRVQHRQIIYVQGYDPRGLAQYYRMFRTELRKFGRLYQVKTIVTRPKHAGDGEIASWSIETKADGWQTRTAYDFLRSTTRFHTRRISQFVTADVLLLAGADDHYVPLKQLGRQAANLKRARSVTTRTFTAAEQASNHCQVGNIGAAVRVIQAWLEISTSSRLAEKADSAGEFVR